MKKIVTYCIRLQMAKQLSVASKFGRSNSLLENCVKYITIRTLHCTSSIHTHSAESTNSAKQLISSKMYQAPNIRHPTLDEVESIARSQNLGLSKDQLKEYHDVMCDMFSTSLSVLEKYVEPVKPIKYPRTPGYRPQPEDNKYHAWYYKTDIKGATSGPLKGYRIVFKDNFPVAGVPMMIGSRVFEGYVPDYDATVVTRVLDAGGHIVGKAVCENMTSGGNSFTSCPLPVLNPHDPSRSSGGSSSGCAVLLQQKEADMAVCNDAGGSVRVPAAWTGLVGLKPSHGLVPCTGLPQFWSPAVEVCGPMARCVKDCALILEVLAGDDEGQDSRQNNTPKVQDIPHYSQLLSGDLTGYKIGVVKEGFNGCEEDVAAIVREAVNKLTQKGATVEDVSIPIHTDVGAITLPTATLGFYHMAIRNNGFAILPSEAYPTSAMANFTAFLRGRRGDLPVTGKLASMAGQFIDDNYGLYLYGKSQNLLKLVRDEYNKVFEKYDVVVMPTVKYKAPKLPQGDVSFHDYMKQAKGMLVNTLVFNGTGHPSLSVSAGFSKGLPVGMMISGHFMQDQQVLNVAYAWEEIRDAIKE